MSNSATTNTDWPAIPYAEWQSTATALHLYSQIVGKYRLSHSPWVNHSWHATLYVTARGLTTSLIPDQRSNIEITLDFFDHVVRGQSESGAEAGFSLQPMSVARFHQQFIGMINELGGSPTFHGTPNELPDPVPFAEDTQERPYDAEAVASFHSALVSIQRVFQNFRTGYRGKVSPVHLFWGSFDLAVTRFSGRTAPLHPGGIPALPDVITREAYSHEVCSAGFWPGGGPIDEAAFYAYAYPQPEGFSSSVVRPDGAYFDDDFGEYILPYEVVRGSAEPERVLMDFLESTYQAAATLGDWDRTLECERGLIGTPPAIDSPG